MARIETEPEIRVSDPFDEQGKRLGILVKDVLNGHAHAADLPGGLHHAGQVSMLSQARRPSFRHTATGRSRMEHHRAGLSTDAMARTV